MNSCTLVFHLLTGDVSSTNSIRLDWTPDELDRVLRQALRRMSDARAWARRLITLSSHRPKRKVVTPDAILPPGVRGLAHGRRITSVIIDDPAIDYPVIVATPKTKAIHWFVAPPFLNRKNTR